MNANDFIQTTVMAINDRIVALLEVDGHKVERTENGHIQRVDGFWIGVEIRAEREAYGYINRKKNGKFRVIVGDYGDKTQFPQKADGTFSYLKIVECIVSKVHEAQRCKKSRAERDAKDSVNQEIAERLNAQFGCKAYSSGVYLTTTADGRLELKGAENLTEEQARMILAVLCMEREKE